MNHNPSVNVVRKIDMYYFIREMMMMRSLLGQNPYMPRYHCFSERVMCKDIILLLLTMRLMYHKDLDILRSPPQVMSKPSFIRNVCKDRMVLGIISKHN